MLRVTLVLSLVVLVGALVFAQEKEPQKKPTVEQVAAKYGPQIKKLDGIVDVGLAMKGEKDLILLQVKSKKDNEFLDNLLSDELEGYRVAFEVTGEPSPTETGGTKPDPIKEAKPPEGTPLCFR